MADHGQTGCARLPRSRRSTPASRASSRSAPIARRHLYLQPGCRLDPRAVAARLDGVEGRRGVAVSRRAAKPSRAATGEELVFAPTAGGLFTLSGDASILDHPDALHRTWAALANPNAGEILVSAAEGHEFADLGGGDHVGGGSPARSSPATRRCRCCWSMSRARPGASSTSHLSSSLISASRRPRTRWVRAA